MADDSVTVSPGPQFKTAMLLAIAADVLQLAVFPLFVEGALSPADDILDLGMAALLTKSIPEGHEQELREACRATVRALIANARKRRN